MNKQELIDLISDKTGISKRKTKAVIDTAIELASDSLVSGEPVVIRGFCTLDVRMTPARRIGGVATLKIPERRVVFFRCGDKLKTRVNKEVP